LPAADEMLVLRAEQKPAVTREKRAC
jgi:hypothetical protein